MTSLSENLISRTDSFFELGVGMTSKTSSIKTYRAYLLEEDLDSPPLANPMLYVTGCGPFGRRYSTSHCHHVKEDD